MQNLALVSLRYSQVAAVGGLQGDDSTMLPREPWFTQPAGDNGIAPGPLTLVIGIQIAANFLGPRTLALEWDILELCFVSVAKVGNLVPVLGCMALGQPNALCFHPVISSWLEGLAPIGNDFAELGTFDSVLEAATWSLG